MGLFKDMLKDNESLFKDEIALDYDYLPKVLPYREKEQRQIATCIAPLLQKRNARNLFVYGAPGIGKTAAARHVLLDLEKETDDVIPIYINCWKKNTTYRIAYEICELLGLKFLQNKKSDELVKLAKDILNKKSVVFIFDEVDKLEDFDFLYFILEEIYRKSVILITNYRTWFAGLDERVKSRLTAETLEFKQYNAEETKGIMKHRLGYAFYDNVWEDDAFNIAAEKTAELKDIRSGLYILKEAGLAAEERASRKIIAAHVRLAISKLEDFSVKKSTDLGEELRKILHLIKENNNVKIGDLYKIYQEHGGVVSYKTFQRKIKKLQDGKFISVTKTEGGDLGNTSIIKLAGIKKLTDF